VPHVLIVDDDSDVLEVLATGLEIAGACHVEKASSAEQAIAGLERQRPDAAIIDASLPKTDGLTLARQLIDRHIPVLVISGDPKYLQPLTEAGCPFLAKPFRMEGLLAALGPLLQEGEAQLAPLKAALDRLAAKRP
jgi:two-component system OmpR family response regulator